MLEVLSALPGPEWLWSWSWLPFTIPPWFLPALQAFLLGMLIESVRHQRTLLKWTDSTGEKTMIAALLDEAHELAREKGYEDELHERFEDRAEEVGHDLALIRMRHEGLLERFIRRWLM